MTDRDCITPIQLAECDPAYLEHPTYLAPPCEECGKRVTTGDLATAQRSGTIPPPCGVDSRTLRERRDRVRKTLAPLTSHLEPIVGYPRLEQQLAQLGCLRGLDVLERYATTGDIRYATKQLRDSREHAIARCALERFEAVTRTGPVCGD